MKVHQNIEGYSIIKYIGNGVSSNVFLVEKNKQLFAMKMISTFYTK